MEGVVVVVVVSNPIYVQLWYAAVSKGGCLLHSPKNCLVAEEGGYDDETGVAMVSIRAIANHIHANTQAQRKRRHLNQESREWHDNGE